MKTEVQWVEFNDSTVKPVGQAEVIAAGTGATPAVLPRLLCPPALLRDVSPVSSHCDKLLSL